MVLTVEIREHFLIKCENVESELGEFRTSSSSSSFTALEREGTYL